MFDNLTTCPWYNWNKKNRQMLLVFMTASMKPQSFTIIGDLSLNYEYLPFVSICIDAVHDTKKNKTFFSYLKLHTATLWCCITFIDILLCTQIFVTNCKLLMIFC